MAITIYIAYVDSAHSAIASWFASAQDEIPGGAPENYATSTTDDPLWKAYYDAQPGSIQQYLPAPTSN